MKKSGSAGEQLKEAQAINKSLSALGDVIAALAGEQVRALTATRMTIIAIRLQVVACCSWAMLTLQYMWRLPHGSSPKTLYVLGGRLKEKHPLQGGLLLYCKVLYNSVPPTLHVCRWKTIAKWMRSLRRRTYCTATTC